MARIFISCSSKDSKAALTLCKAVEARGYPCWLASRDVGPGQNFQEEIVRAIAAAPLMVLVFSANANNSGEIKKELALASQGQLVVVPVRIEDVAPSGAFVYELATRQWIDLFGDWEDAIDRLVRQIALAVPEGADTPVLAAAPQPENKSRMPLFAGIAVVLLAVAAAGVWLMRPAPPPQPEPPHQVMAQTPLPAVDPARLESDLWDSVKDSGDAGALNSYLVKFPNGTFAAAAKAKLAALNKPAPVKLPDESVVKTAIARPQVASVETKPAEAKPESKPAAASGLNPQVAQAVDMAHAAERQARAVATEAQQAAAQARAGAAGYGLRTFNFAGNSVQWAGRLAVDASGGSAVVQYADGESYAGQTLEGRRNGMGIHTGGPSQVYRERAGQFSANQLNGYAVVYRKDGRVRAGHWKDSVLDGYAAVFDAEGHVLQQGLYASDTLATPMTAN